MELWKTLFTFNNIFYVKIGAALNVKLRRLCLPHVFFVVFVQKNYVCRHALIGVRAYVTFPLSLIHGSSFIHGRSWNLYISSLYRALLAEKSTAIIYVKTLFPNIIRWKAMKCGSINSTKLLSCSIAHSRLEENLIYKWSLGTSFNIPKSQSYCSQSFSHCKEIEP